MSSGLRDGMQEQERAYEQQDILAERQAIAAEREQIAAERAAGVAQRAADRQATTTQNFAKTLEFDAQAIQHRTNPVTKTVEAVNDPLTGQPNARDLKGPVEYDPTGRAVQTIRKDGVFKVEDLDKDAEIGRNPDDKNDPNIYVKNKARPWSAFAPNDALVHPDTRIQNEAAKTLMREDADKLTTEEKTLRAELSHPDYDGVTQAKIDEAQKRKAGGYSTPEYDAVLSKAETIRQKKERLSQIGIEQATQGTMTAEEFAAKRLASMDPAAVNAPRQKLLEAQRAGITAIKTKLDAEDAQYAADYEAFLPRTKNFLPQDAPAIREQMGQMTLRKQMIDAKRRSLEEDVAKHDAFIKSLNEQAATRQAATVAASAVGAPQTDKKSPGKAPESVPFEKALTEAKAGTLPWSKIMEGEKARLDMLRTDGSAPETVKAMDRAVRVLSSMDPANGEDEQGIIQAQKMFGAEVAKAAEKDAATQEANRAKAAAAYANVIAPRDEMDSLPDEEQFRLSQEHQKANFLGKHEDAPAFYSKEFGSLNVNPRLVFKPDEYTAAVEASDAPPLAKEKAMQALPLMQQEAAKPVFQAFNENPVIAEAFYASKAKTAKRLGAPGISTASHPQEQAEAVADFMASPDFSPNWNQIVLGVSRGLSGLRQSVAGVGSFFGSDAAQRSGEKEIEAQQREGAAAAAGGGSELLGSLASGATSLVPSIGVGIVTGGAGFGAQGALAASAAAAGAQSGGATMIEAKKAGMGEMQSRLTALASGAITAGLTRAGGTTGAEAVLSKLFAPGKEATLSVVKPALVKAIVEKVKGYAVEGAKEVLEEVPDQLFQNVLAGATYKPGQDSAEGLVDTAIVSFLLGGGVNAATDVAGGVKAKFNAEKEIKSATVRRELGQQIAAQHSPAIITETLAGSPMEERTPEVLSKIAEFDARIVDGQEQLAGAKSKAQTLYSNNQLAQAYGQREEYIAGIRSELRDSFVSAAEEEIDTAEPPPITDANGLETPGDAAGFEQDKARAKALVAIASGKVDSLDNAALALVGLSRGPGGELKAGGKADSPDGTARVTIENGELVIGQSTIDRMTELFPATAPLIGQSEAERRAAVIANVTATEAARQPQEPGGAETSTKIAESTQPQEKPVGPKPGQDATFEVEIDDVADAVTIAAATREDAEVAAMRQYPGKMIRSVNAVAPVTGKMSPAPADKITKAPEVIPTGKYSLQVAPKEAVKPAPPTGISPASIAKAITSASGRRPSKKEAVRYQAVAKALSKEATRWQAAFPGGFTTTQNSGSGGVQVDSGTATPSLRLDFKALAESVDALGSNSLQWVERAIQEEVIHSVAVQMESRGEINMTELFDALPAETQAQVRAAYPSSNKSLNLGHEFFRMVVQQRLSGRKPKKGRPVLTEQTMPAAVLAKLSAALEKLLTYFRDLAATLKKQKASPDTIARVTAAADMLEAGVRALSAEGSTRAVEGSRAPKKKRTEKARFRLDPENSPVVTALVEAGISPRNPAARLAAMRKKNGGRLSEKDRAVLRNLGEWDNVPRQSDWQGRPIAQDAIRRMVNQSNTNSPDQALQQAAETLGEDPKDFYGRQVWDRVTAELMALDEAPGKVDAADERADAQERQAVEFYAAVENGRVKVNARDLEVGETLIIEGDRVVVQSLETGPDGKLQGITLKDGTRFGVQEIDPSTVLFVEDYAPNDPDWSVVEQNQPEMSDNAGSGEPVVTNTPESLAGEKIDKEWTAFAEDSRSLGIPREQMPQIKTEHRGALANFLRAGGIEFTRETALPGSLHPTQAEYSPAKVKQAREWVGESNRAILVSSDDHVLDGHHQWLAAMQETPGEPMDVIRLDAPIRELLEAVAQFPSAGMEAAPAPAGVVSADGQQDFLAGAQDEPFNLAAESEAQRLAREARELAGANAARAREVDAARKAAEQATPELPLSDTPSIQSQPVISPLTNEERQAVLSVRPQPSIGGKGPTPKNVFRGESNKSGSNSYTYGKGRYTTTDRAQAAQFGEVKILPSAGNLPENPLYFPTENAFETFMGYVMFEAVKARRASDFNARFGPDTGEFLKSIYPDADGIQIGTGKGSFYVRWPASESLQAQSPAALAAATLSPDGFYSAAVKMLEAKMPARASKEQVKALLANVKADELKWSGVVPWLDFQGGTVTKEAVLNFMRNEGRVQFEEVVNGPETMVFTEGFPTKEELVEQASGDRELMNFQNELRPNLRFVERNGLWNIADSSSESDARQYAQYQLPGGENYREIVLSMPPKRTEDQKKTPRQLAKEMFGVDSIYDLTEDQQRQLMARNEVVDRPYTSPHFTDVPNYVAHLRTNERKDSSGSPGLFIEEIQSDRGQQIRKESGTIHEGKTPSMPFEKTWPLQMFKRALRDAVAAGSPSWKDATKPDSIGKLSDDLLGAKYPSRSTLGPVEAGVLRLAGKHDQVRRAIVAAVPVDVVRYLADHKLSPEQLIGGSDVVWNTLPVDGRPDVANGVIDALVKTSARLGAALNTALSGRSDKEILPTLKASALTAREVVGLLAPVGIANFVSDQGGVKPVATGAGAELGSLVFGLENNATGHARNGSASTGQHPRSGLAGTATEGFTGTAKEPASTELARLLNVHAGIVNGNAGDSSFIPSMSWIGWTTGTTQADRFDLSKQVSRVEYYPSNQELRAYGLDGSPVLSETVAPEKIEDYIGKEVAKKLIEKQPESLTRGRQAHVLSGDGLAMVGGEGMKGFYDNILPKEVAKYVKQWGGRVEQDLGKGPSAEFTAAVAEADRTRMEYGITDPRHQAAYAAIPADSGVPATGIPMWKVQITPEMASTVAEVGQPLYAQSPKRLLEQLGVDTAEIDARTAQAGFEQSGNRTIIDPERALGAGTGAGGVGDDVIMATSDLYAEEVTAETVEQWNAAAVEMLSRDYEGTFRAVTSVGRRGGILSPEQTRAAQMMTEFEARQPMDQKQMQRMQLLVWSNRLAGTEAARSLRARVDPFKTRQERHREAVAKGIFMPPPEVRAELETAQTPEERTAIIAKDGKRIKAIKDALAKMGLTIDDVLAGDRMLVARRRDIVGSFLKGQLADKEVAAAVDALDGTATFQTIADKHGLSEGAAASAFEKARAKFREELRRRVNIAAAAKGQTGVLNSQAITPDPWVEFDFGGIADLSPVEQELALDRIMQRVGFFPKSQQGKRKVVTRKPVPPAAGGMSLDDYVRMPMPRDIRGEQPLLPGPLLQPGRPVEMSVVVGADLADVNDVYRLMRIQQAAGAGAFDMLREYWINNLLSGPVTQFKNATSNLLFGGWNLFASRGMEAMLNVVAQNDKSASMGEFGAIMKALGPAWERGIKLAALSWDTEADHFAHKVLNEQLSLIDTGPVGEYRKIAIGGTKGRIVRMPGRMLMAADGFFKGLFGTMEAGAHAYRITKAEGLTPGSQAFNERMERLLIVPGSPAWIAAVRQAETNTFQNKLDPSQNPIDAVPQMIVSAGQSKHLAIRLLATVLFPFTKTPYNVYREGIRRSPLGAVVLGAQMAKAGWVKLQGGKVAPTVPPALIRGLAEQLFAWTGTALLMSAIEGDDDDYEKGFLITGSAPKEKGARELQERAFGGPYVVKIGRTVIPYGGIEPIATVLGTVADFVRSGKTDGTPQEKMNAVFHSVKRGALDKTFLSGLKSMSDLLGMDETSGGPTMAEKARRFALQGIVPNIIRQPLRNSDSRVPDGASSEWMYDAVPMPDWTTGRVNPGSGEEKQKTGNAVSRLLIPSAIQPEESVHPVDRALLAWNRANPADSWAPQGASKTLEIGEQRIELNAQALRFLNVRAGTLARKMLAGEPLKGDQESLDRIKDAYSDARKQARDELKARPLDQIGTVKQ